MWAERRRFVWKSIWLETPRVSPLPHTTGQLIFLLCPYPDKKPKAVLW